MAMDKIVISRGQTTRYEHAEDMADWLAATTKAKAAERGLLADLRGYCIIRFCSLLCIFPGVWVICLEISGLGHLMEWQGLVMLAVFAVPFYVMSIVMALIAAVRICRLTRNTRAAFPVQNGRVTSESVPLPFHKVDFALFDDH